MKNSNRQSCSCLRNVGGSFLLTCNFDVCSLLLTLPCFYKECLKSCTTFMEWDNDSANMDPKQIGLLPTADKDGNFNN